MGTKVYGGITKDRWLKAQEQERRGVERSDEINQSLKLRRDTWARLLNRLKEVIYINESTRILEIGSGPTSIFLSLRCGIRYALDPNFDHMFKVNPFLRNIDEYKDVIFISKTAEDFTLDQPRFDLIFSINMLDHVGDLECVVKNIRDLIAPFGILILVVDCYADERVKSFVQFIDPDPAHPHHFIYSDIINIFHDYKLIKIDSSIWNIFFVDSNKNEVEIQFFQFSKFIMRLKNILLYLGKSRDLLFIIKYVGCFGIALIIAIFRRKQNPVYPLKKACLFVFQNNLSL
jgi:SAM-dependent methyltransferase